MTTAGIRTMIVAAGLAAALVAPAVAQVSRAEGQAIARSLAGQGYSDVSIDEDDGEVTVSATREGERHSFSWDRDGGRLEPVGGDDDDGRPNDDGRRGAEAEDDGPGNGSGDDGDGGRDGDDGSGGDEGAGGNDDSGGDEG